MMDQVQYELVCCGHAKCTTVPPFTPGHPPLGQAQNIVLPSLTIVAIDQYCYYYFLVTCSCERQLTIFIQT